MNSRNVSRIAIGIPALLLITGAVPQQAVLPRLGLTDAVARELALEGVGSGGTDSKVISGRWHGRLVQQGRKSFQRLPAAERASAATGLFAWAKSFTTSPTFKAAYAKVRADQKPRPRAYTLTIDQEIKKMVDQQLAGQEQMKKAAASMSPKEREQFLATLKQAEEQARNSNYLEAVRAEKVAERAREQESTDQATKEWEVTFPVDPNGFVAKALRTFLEGTAGVDYAAEIVTAVGEGGEQLWFANMSYRETKPWMWVEAILVGKEAVTAARGAAENWLREIGN